MYSSEEMIVLDPFMGLGTTGVACNNLNRNFIGIELDDKYFEIAKDRLNE
jgi:site-specific DNA-methyltransferase (adenine-specific)